MTFYEIYSSVVMKLWGDTTPPTSAATYLQGANGLIANVHKRLQQDYNFWFMRAWTYWVTVAETQTYGLPTEFKEIINLQFKVADEDYFTQPLSILRLTAPFETQWPYVGDSIEYPQFYELVGNDITIYPAPSGIRTLHLIYWTFLSRPTATDFVSVTSTEDPLTEVAGEIISYMVAGEYSLIMKEYDQAQVYNAKAQELIIELKQEDFRRRQAPMQSMDYGEF